MRPREADGIEVGHGGDCPSAPDLEVYRAECRLGLLGGELIGNSPAWALGRVAQFLLLGDGVDLEDDAIGGYGRLMASHFPVVEEL